ncbi:MAG: carboxylesterase family protein, partial [Saprospiraceae bacterium]|nr:carboxylesterase family protein [Saprospiraceae bacterium]
AKTIEWSATALASDRFIAYSTWKWFDLARKNSSQPVYRYLYSKKRPPLVDQDLASGLAGGTVRRDANTPPPPQPIGAPHACEIEYCMGNLPLVKDYAWTEDDYTVSKTMQQYFANFIIHGNPNGDGLSEWPAAPATSDAPPVMIINVESKAMPAENDARYRFLAKQYQ